MLEKIINKRNYFMYINKITISINMLFFFYFMIHDSLEITMPLFFEKYKINIVYLGMLISISKILRSIIIIPLSNIRMNKKIKVLYFVLFTNILLNVFSIILRNVYLILFYFLFFLISTSVFNVIINPILAINTPEDKLGITFGIRDVFLYIGSFIGLLITGKIVDISNNYNNLSFMYIILFVFLILNLKSIQKLNGVNLSYSENKKDKHSASKLVNIFKIEKRFLYYIGVNTIIIIGTSSLTYMPLIGKEYGISDSGIYYIFSSSIFFTAFMSLIGGIIIDKFNKKKIYIVNTFLYLIVLYLFGINNKVLFVIGILITSVQMAFANINSTYLFETFSNEKVEKYWGIISVVSLISSSMGIFLSGYLWEINPSIMLLFSFLTTFLGFILTFKLPVKNDRM